MAVRLIRFISIKTKEYNIKFDRCYERGLFGLIQCDVRSLPYYQ